MESREIKERVQAAIDQLKKSDIYLLENNLNERCIASRLAMYLQNAFTEFSVDVEYNRKGVNPKAVGLPEECGNRRDDEGHVLVVPDIIVHSRGEKGPNILALELKKSTNRESRDCDSKRIHAFREQLGYICAATIECETRENHEPRAAIVEWL